MGQLRNIRDRNARNAPCKELCHGVVVDVEEVDWFPAQNENECVAELPHLGRKRAARFVEMALSNCANMQ